MCFTNLKWLAFKCQHLLLEYSFTWCEHINAWFNQQEQNWLELFAVWLQTKNFKFLLFSFTQQSWFICCFSVSFYNNFPDCFLFVLNDFYNSALLKSLKNSAIRALKNQRAPSTLYCRFMLFWVKSKEIQRLLSGEIRTEE